MVKEYKVEYERVDEENDKYKRILVKFNPRSSRESDFEIEFIPLVEAYKLGEIFVTEIDSMSTIDLYRWATRHFALAKGDGGCERGTILTKDENLEAADYMRDGWRKGEVKLKPRQIVSRVKRVFEEIKKRFNDPTAFTYNHFLYTGELGSLPPLNVGFNVEELRKAIEGISYSSINADEDMVERPLVRHLFGTHKTKYVVNTIINFLNVTCVATWKALAEFEKKHR